MKHLGVWQLALGRDASPSFPAICHQYPILVKWRDINALSRAGFTWEQGWMFTWVGFFTPEWIFNFALQWDKDHVNVRAQISVADPNLQIGGGGGGAPPGPLPWIRHWISRHRGKTHPKLSGTLSGRWISGYRIVLSDGSSPRLSRFAQCVYFVVL